MSHTQQIREAAWKAKAMINAMTSFIPIDGRSADQIVRDIELCHNVVVASNGGALQQSVFRGSHMGSMDIEYTDCLINPLFEYYGDEK